MTGLLFFAMLFAAYFLPALNAVWRGHHNTAPITIVNLFFGWTLIGWVICLAWSASAIRKAV